MRCKHESEHSALLFLRADTPAALDTSLAALAGPDILDLPEKDAREDATKIAAALGWLAAHPGWLMIVDNVDDPAAVAAVDKLLARLSGGKVIVTGRAGNFPASLRKLELGVLDEAGLRRLPVGAHRRRPRASRPTTRSWRRNSPANSAAWRSGSNRRAPISRPSASASRAISNCGARSARPCSTGSTRR